MSFNCIPDSLANRPLYNDRAYGMLERRLAKARVEWMDLFRGSLNEFRSALIDQDFQILPTDRQLLLVSEHTKEFSAFVTGRLKQIRKIIEKMKRFNEPLTSMLDIWGFRIVVREEHHINFAVEACERVWTLPSPKELRLRNGTLEFPAKRDYRLKNHAGLSPSTSSRYDEAVHLNRRMPFGICEIQIMTLDLYQRACVTNHREESHLQFTCRRKALFR